MEILITVGAIAAIVLIIYILFKVFKLVTRIIILALFLLVAYFTNPGLERHVAAVKKKAEEKHVTVREKHITVKDLKVASLTQITRDGDTKVVGIAGFTQVLVFRIP